MAYDAVPNMEPVITGAKTEPVKCELPLTSNVPFCGTLPIPTCEPETVSVFALNRPITTRSSLNTSRIGKPEISLTDMSEPLRLSVMPNKEPDEPMNTIEPSGSTSKRMLDEALPLN